MEHVSKVLDRVYKELQAKSDKNKELNHEILSLETAQKLADYEKLKKKINKELDSYSNSTVESSSNGYILYQNIKGIIGDDK